tara:strand:+ start:5818 stop:5961 length:144 start_codon:yes stop_codon:yes gene_type:complete
MSEVLETITIETLNGLVDINKSDYDSKIHKLPGAVKKAVKPTKKPTK